MIMCAHKHTCGQDITSKVRNTDTTVSYRQGTHRQTETQADRQTDSLRKLSRSLCHSARMWGLMIDSLGAKRLLHFCDPRPWHMSHETIQMAPNKYGSSVFVTLATQRRSQAAADVATILRFPKTVFRWNILFLQLWCRYATICMHLCTHGVLVNVISTANSVLFGSLA